MKRIFTALMLLIMAGALFAQPKLSFTSTRHDYGTIKEADGKKEAVFNFTNTGDSVLVLSSRRQGICHSGL